MQPVGIRAQRRACGKLRTPSPRLGLRAHNYQGFRRTGRTGIRIFTNARDVMEHALPSRCKFARGRLLERIVAQHHDGVWNAALGAEDRAGPHGAIDEPCRIARSQRCRNGVLGRSLRAKRQRGRQDRAQRLPFSSGKGKSGAGSSSLRRPDGFVDGRTVHYFHRLPNK